MQGFPRVAEVEITVLDGPRSAADRRNSHPKADDELGALFGQRGGAEASVPEALTVQFEPSPYSSTFDTFGFEV